MKRNSAFIRSIYFVLLLGIGLVLCRSAVFAATSASVINNSSTTVATYPSTMKHLVRTSDGTLHSFVQIGTQTATCGGSSKSGLLWFYSTDSGATWTCGDQLSSDTTYFMYASATVDSSDNIYTIYSSSSYGTAYDVFYRKLTKGVGASWTVEAAQTVLDSSSATTGYSFATIEAQGTTRLWMATRYFDGTNYQVSVYYSNGLTAAPSWTQSVATLETAGNSASYHIPTMVRFGTNIGVIYNDQNSGYIRWRYRADGDGLTSWSSEGYPGVISSPTVPGFSTAVDSQGNIYLAVSYSTSIYFSYWNGTVWSPAVIVSSAGANNSYTSVSTDGTNAWVYYLETTGLSTGLTGASKLVYKKGTLPFGSAEFDTTATAVASYHGIFDKYWSYVSSAYTDDTTDAGNTTSADTQMVTGVGNIAYFGKTAKFDVIAWDVSTAGAGGAITWEYWNGSSWASLTFTVSTNTNFQGDGWGAFTDPADWATTTVNGEGTSYYYIRARTTTGFTTSPVGVEMTTIPWTNYVSALASNVSNSLYAVWSENVSAPVRARFGSVSISAATANTAATANIAPSVVGYSSTTAATQPSTMRKLVRTSDGTLHAFIQAGSSLPCGSSTSSGNNIGLVWIYSTDSGSTWTCGSQLSSNTSLYASATVDSSDNIYVVYSYAVTLGNAAYDTFYRKLTKGVGATWTVESAQTVLDSSSSTTAYTYSTVELQGTTRLWLATRYYDGSNYQVSVYYSDGLTAAPSWTQSAGTLNTASTNTDRHYPIVLRFGSNIGVVYANSSAVLVWKFRADSDGLTSWSQEMAVGSISNASPTFSAVGDTSGNVYVANNYSTSVTFSYWNGTVWSASATISSAASSSLFVSVATDGVSAWVYYPETTGLSAGLSGNRKLVYKKGVFPFTASDFDSTSTSVISYHNMFDKYWSYVSSAYTDDTTDAGNTTTADTQTVTGAGDIVYFGKTTTFDAVVWDLSTAGVGGQIAWEYYNGSSWVAITDFAYFSNPSFTGDGYISFIPASDWATTTVNGEGTAYYYVRARTLTAFTTSPIGVQTSTIPLLNWASLAVNAASNAIYGIWTDIIRVRYSAVSVTTSTANTATTANISPNVVGYSSTTAATYPPTMRNLVRTSDGTLHSFVQAGSNSACGSSRDANNLTGLNWLYSTDSGSTWTCGGQLTSNVSVYASATVDSSDNIYVVYAYAVAGGSASYDTFYQKLTKGSGASWTVETAQTVLNSTASTTGYSFASVEIQGTTRLWLAVRYYDGTNYQVSVYYSDGLTTAPTWTVSQATLNTAGTTNTYHVPIVVRFGSNIGIVYNDQSTGYLYWRFRADSDGLTAWRNQEAVNSSVAQNNVMFSAAGDTNGNVYVAVNNGVNIYFTYWNGTVWSTATTVSSAAASNAFVSVSTDGVNAWVFYGETTGLSSGLTGSRKLVYKKGVFPFSAADFDANATAVVSQHGTFDKYWSFVSSAYTDDTADAGSTAATDTQMVTGVGDIAYFGKTAKFDTVAWDLSTNGAGGMVVWEYWNGSSWVAITDFLPVSGQLLTADGYITFIPASDWATTNINGEGTANYYVRARVTTAYTTSPVGTQTSAIPLISYMSVATAPASNTIYGIWTEAGAPTRVRFSTVSVTTSTANTVSTANISPAVVAYSSTTLATQTSPQRKIVRTSDGTLHAFVQSNLNMACGSSTGSSNNTGLNWLYSTDSGSTWTCGSQLSSNTSLYASATVDSSDNIYVVYSYSTSGGSTAYDTFYRKLTKGSGASWTVESEQTAINSTGTLAYNYSTVELEGTTRLWLATRYYDGTNYQTSVYYSDGLSAAPTWSVSQATLGTASTTSDRHYPSVVRFGSNIGVVYSNNSRILVWRYRADSDGLTTWATQATVLNTDVPAAVFSAVGDTSGYVYAAVNNATSIFFTYWNGSAWSTSATVSSAAASSAFVSVSTYGGNVWVMYGETTGLSGGLTGSRKIVYKLGVSPFATANFDTNATALISQHGTFNKYWSYVSSAYTDDTTDAGNTTATDTQVVTGVGDIAYFGKTAKFDTVAWDLSTNGVAGQIAWEYYNGASWVAITDFSAVSNPTFAGDGYITFIPPSDWTTIAVNSEGTSYYYVRARVITAYTTSPVGAQMAAIPNINWVSIAASGSNLYTVWTENAAAPMRTRFAIGELNNPPNSPSSLGPNSIVDGSAGTMTQPALQFTLSDPNSADTIKYQIQVDDSSDFSSAVIDYTSAFGAQGAITFTVGQDAGTGSYTTGSSGQTLSDGSYYWRVRATDNTLLASSYATANSGSIAFKIDTAGPATNASTITMLRAAGGTSVTSNDWSNNSSPYISWSGGADNSGGSGLKGYCLYLGADSDGNPATAKGLLGTSPVSTTGSTCQFIISTTSIDFSTSSYKGSTWLTSATSAYYINIKAIDNANQVFSASSTQFQFRFDNTSPTNVSHINPASGTFSNVVDMSFSWPTSGSTASTDSHAGILGWQYQLNATSGSWQGTTRSTALDLDYVPATASAYTFTLARDSSSVVSGSNTIYFRTIDASGNTSSDATIRTGNISYGGAAPSFISTDSVTITPATSTSNSYALSWPVATPASGQSVAAYYYMINTTPPATYATLIGNTSTYISNGTSRTVSATALSNVNKGSNTVYVVAVDNASTPNYSPSNYISGTFTLNSTDPDNVGNLVASDSSIKSQSQWNVTLTWTAPTYQGAGSLTYLIYRSIDNSSFSQVGSTSGLSYVDSAPSSTAYYYKVYTRDGANAQSSGTNSVSITPTGKWTSAPTLDSGPTAGSITTKKATITWSTSRTADSKIQYGTSSGSYGSVEPSNSSQVSSHSISLTGLSPGITYYYKAKWTDEDGNTGTSSEKNFTTASAPTVTDPKAKSIGLTSAIIQYTTNNASSVKIYYGTTSSFGGATTVSTSTSETTYTTELTGLLDGTKYYYKINTFDSESTEYEGSILTFETLPRPKITNVRVQQVAGTAQSTLLVTWTTNTDISSIITYYPEGKPIEARDEVNVALTKGEHRMIVRGLAPQTVYFLIVKGRDKIGNEASSDSQKLTTATDTRPPQISDLHIEGSNIPTVASTAQESTAQLIVSWNTDETATSQVEFGEGTGTTYAQKTQEDINLTINHIVIISGLSPSKVYHLRALAKDKAGNMGNSIDSVTITPKATENALNLVITNLQEAFGFLGGLKK